VSIEQPTNQPIVGNVRFAIGLGLVYTPYTELDDDVDYINYPGAIQYVQSIAILDPRNYLWTVGANGVPSTQVWDLSLGVSQAYLLATYPLTLMRDLASVLFVRPAANPSKIFMVGNNYFADVIQVFDVSSVTAEVPRVHDQLPLPNSQSMIATPDGKYIYAEV
jgi:hypothetical protein